MDREKFLEELFPLIGGKENTSLCEFQDDVLYVALKDAGLADENAVAKLPDVASATLRRGRLTVTFGTPERKEEVPFMANKNTDYRALAKEILANVGGKENIATAVHCATRLRLTVKDKNNVNLDALKHTKGAFGAQWSGEQLQVIIGNDVPEFYKVFCTEAGVQKAAQVPEDKTEEKHKEPLTVKSVLKKIIDAIVGCIIPAIPGMLGASLIRTLAIILNMVGVLAADSPTYQILDMAGTAGMYFFPLVIAYTAAVKFNANPSLAIVLNAVLLYPDFISNVTNGTAMSIFGLPVYAGSYANMIFPPIMTVFVMSYVERFFDKHCPKSLRIMLPPLLTLAVMLPLELCVIAPIGLIIGDAIGSGLIGFYNAAGFIAPAVFTAVYPFLVLTGMHYATIPAGSAMWFARGYDPMIFPSMYLYNFMQGAATFGVAIKSKKSEIKGLATSCGISALIAGITEPALFGISLPYKTPLIASMIGGAVAGAYMGITKTGLYAAGGNGIFSIVSFISSDPMTLINGIISVALGMVVTFALTILLYKDPSDEVKA